MVLALTCPPTLPGTFTNIHGPPLIYVCLSYTKQQSHLVAIYVRPSFCLLLRPLILHSYVSILIGMIFSHHNIQTNLYFVQQCTCYCVQKKKYNTPTQEQKVWHSGKKISKVECQGLF